jgi:hypothetical protein
MIGNTTDVPVHKHPYTNIDSEYKSSVMFKTLLNPTGHLRPSHLELGCQLAEIHHCVLYRFFNFDIILSLTLLISTSFVTLAGLIYTNYRPRSAAVPLHLSGFNHISVQTSQLCKPLPNHKTAHNQYVWWLRDPQLSPRRQGRFLGFFGG